MTPETGSLTGEAQVDHLVVFVAPPEAVEVLRAVLTYLPADFPAAIVILLHVGKARVRPVADNLNVNRGLMVLPGADGVRLRNQHAYVVRPDQKLAIGHDGCLTAASAEDSLGEVVPAEALLASAAVRFGAGTIAVALTELEVHEAEGFRKVREAEGHTIALDEADRLWTSPAGPRVVPAPADEFLPARAIGERMLAMFSPRKDLILR